MEYGKSFWSELLRFWEEDLVKVIIQSRLFPLRKSLDLPHELIKIGAIPEQWLGRQPHNVISANMNDGISHR